ncbi:hypothetical protein Tco_0936368, partial [Tanacetum coccineum]
FDTINDLAKNDLVTGLPKFKYHKEHLCPSCEQGKSKRASHPPKPVPNSKQRLHLLHMDLCGPMRIASINGKLYVPVIVDDYSCYTWNDREDIGKLGAKGDIGFFIGYSANSCAYKVYNRRTKKIMETMNVTSDELLTMDFEQSNLKPGLQSMTYGQISSGLDLPYAPSTITTQKPTEGELDLLFKAMYDDHIGGQPSAAPRTVPAAQAPQHDEREHGQAEQVSTGCREGYRQEEGIDLKNPSAPVARMESYQDIFGISAHKSFIVVSNGREKLLSCMVRSKEDVTANQPRSTSRRLKDLSLSPGNRHTGPLVFEDSAKSWLAGPKETGLVLRCLRAEAEYVSSIRLLCPSPLDADTVNELWLSLQQDSNLMVIRNQP